MARRLRNTLQWGLGTPLSSINTDQEAYFGETEAIVLQGVASLINQAFRAQDIPAGRLAEFPLLRKYLARDAGTAGSGRPNVPVTVVLNNPTSYETLPQVVVSYGGSTDIRHTFGQNISLRARGTPSLPFTANNTASTPWSYDLSAIPATERYIVVTITYVLDGAAPLAVNLRLPFWQNVNLLPTPNDLTAVQATTWAPLFQACLDGTGLKAFAVPLDSARTQYRLDLRAPGAGRLEVHPDTPDSVLAALGLGARLGVDRIQTSTGGTTAIPRWTLVPTGAFPAFAAGATPLTLRISGVGVVNGFPQDGEFVVTSVAGDGGSVTYASAYGQAIASGTIAEEARVFLGAASDSLSLPATEEILKSTQNSVRVDVLARDENQRREIMATLDTLLTTFFGDALYSWVGAGFTSVDPPELTPRPDAQLLTRRAWTLHMAAPTSRSGRGDLAVSTSTGDSLMPLSVEGFDLQLISQEVLTRELYRLNNDTATDTRTQNPDAWRAVTMDGWSKA